MRLVSVQRWLGLCECMATARPSATSPTTCAQPLPRGCGPVSLGALVYRASRWQSPMQTSFASACCSSSRPCTRPNVARLDTGIACRQGERWRRRRDRCAGRADPLLLTEPRHHARRGRLWWHVQTNTRPSIGPLRVRCLTGARWPTWAGRCGARHGREDRALVARRRFIERYLGHAAGAPRNGHWDLPWSSRRKSTPRVAPVAQARESRRGRGGDPNRGLVIDATRASRWAGLVRRRWCGSRVSICPAGAAPACAA